MLAKLGGPTEKAVKTGIFHLQSWLEGQESFALAQGPRTQFTLGLISGEKFWRMPGSKFPASLSRFLTVKRHSAPALSLPWTNQVKMNMGKGHEGTEAVWGRAWLSKKAEGQELACACVLFLFRQARVNAPFIP